MGLAILGWVIVGALAMGVLSTFWDEIRYWLNNTAADFVEKHLGYSARNRMHKAVSTVNQVMNNLRNKSVIYTKRKELYDYFDKTTVISEAPVYEIDDRILEEVRKKGELVQEFEYTN